MYTHIYIYVQTNLNTYNRLLLIGHFSSKRGNLVGLSPATTGGGVRYPACYCWANHYNYEHSAECAFLAFLLILTPLSIAYPQCMGGLLIFYFPDLMVRG